MFHYILYKTTNIHNGKFYIGKHITKNLEDGYLGSGLALANAIRKYGRDSFVRVILSSHPDEHSLNEAEKISVDHALINDRCSYNIALGGQGGCIVLKPDHPLYDDTRAKLSEAQRRRSSSISEQMKRLHAEGKTGMHGKTHSEETKRKMSESGKAVPKLWLTGRVLSEESRAKCTGRPKGSVSESTKAQLASLHSAQHKCEHCGMMNMASNHKRWHGDKCKHRV